MPMIYSWVPRRWRGWGFTWIAAGLLAVAALPAALRAQNRPGLPPPPPPPPLSVQASAAPAAPDPMPRIVSLEREAAELRAELAALRERLDALIGSTSDTRTVKLTVGNSPVRGNPDAAVTLYFFGDYQSVYSVRAHYTVKRLLEDYPNALKVVYKHYPLVSLHPQANEAALAAIAAEKQGKFWELHELLFQNSRRLDGALYAVLAEQAGINLSQFERDRRSVGVLERLSEDEQAATQAGVPGVPAVYLNGRPMTTWRYDYLRTQIDALRKR